MHISLSLIINYLNCLKLRNLQNCSISQSINRGIGEHINRMNLGEKSYAGGISSEVFGEVELRVLWLQRSPCFRRWIVILTHSLLLKKRTLIPNVFLNVFHVSWFDEYLWLSTLYIIYLTCPIYMYKLSLWGFALYRWRRNIPESFGGEAEREKIKLGSTIVNRVSLSYLLCFLSVL